MPLSGRPWVLLALGNFEALEEDRFTKIESLCKEKFDGRIHFAAVTFEDFIAAIPRKSVSKNLADTITDFEGYLDENNLLPRWRTRLDVVNCSGRPAEVLEENVYICPARGGPYSHSRAMYFGMYSQKAVRRVATIEAVVVVHDHEDAELRWRNVATSKQELIDLAQQKARRLRPKGGSMNVFLLGLLHGTSFVKASKGGMQASKRYFNVEDHAPASAGDLAEKLRGLTWEKHRAR